MSNTVVGFTIEIDGIQSINQLNAAIAETKKSMNALDLTTEAGLKQFEELSLTLGELTAQQKAFKKAQDDVNKSFLPEKSIGAYDKLSAELNKLRKEFKNAALEGSKTTEELDQMQKEIMQLDSTLKKVDAQVGQFQRSVGDYPRTFQRVTRSLYTAIPGFEAFSDQLKDGEGRLTTFAKALIGGFLAFQAANVINRAITNLDEFNKKMLETRDTVMQMSGAYGENLDQMSAQTQALAETFGTDAKTISEAAKSLSKQLGIGFDEALGKLEGALIEGRGNANDYLAQIKEYPAAFKEAGQEMSAVAEDNRRLVETNKELALSQIKTSKQTKEIVTTFKEFKNAVTGQLINFLVALFNALKPIGSAFYELGKAVYNFLAAIGGIFSSGGKAVSVIDMFASAVRLALAPIQFLVGLITGIINVMTQFYPVVAAAGAVIGTFVLAVNSARIASALASAAQWVYNGAITAYTASVKLAKLAQEGFNKAIKANPIGLAVTGLVAAGGAIAAYTSATKDSTEATEDNTAALSKEEEALKAKAAADEKALAEKMKLQQEEFEAAQKAKEAEQKAAQEKEDAQRKYTAALDKFTQDRKKFLEDETAAQKNALALIAELRARYVEQQIKNIKDERERAVKEVELGAKREVETLDAQFQKLQEENKKRAEEGQKQLDEAVRLYGKGSEKVQQIRDENAKAAQSAAEDEKLVAEEIAKLKVEVNKKAETDINNLKSDFREEDLQKAKEAAEALRDFRNQMLTEEVAYIESQAEFRELKNKETLNKMLANEKDAKKREELIRLAGEQEIVDKIALIRNKIQALDDAETQLIDENGKLREGIKQEEYDAVRNARQKLYTELSELENKQTENVAKNTADQLKERIKSFQDVLNFIKDGTSLLFDALNAANERQQALLDQDIERSQQRQEKLQEEIDNSTGLRRRFYEERLSEEVAAEQRIIEAKEALEKKAAKQKKAQAIIQSIINTALAASSALATPPAPNIVAAAIAGILGAAQTAIIAAQPLAKGGVVGKGDEIVQFANGGRVTHKGNIKPLSNGDNVLATLKTGEIVLNEAQQRRIGYSTLKAAKIPNFAGGGVVGAPTAFVSDQMAKISDEQNRAAMLERMIIETQNRIDRIQVVYTASTDDDVQKGRTERKEIKAVSTF